MTGFLNSLLEGQNLSELNQMAADGDPKHLGVVGRNLQLMAINNRVDAELASALASPSHTDPALEAHRRAADEEQYYARQQADREEAMRRTKFKALPKAERVAAIPDSDEAVDDFVRNLG